MATTTQVCAQSQMDFTWTKLFGVAYTDEELKRRGFPPTTIVGMMYFRQTLDITTVRETLQRRLVEPLPRFRSFLRKKKGTQNPEFVELKASEVDLTHHVTEEAPKNPGPEMDAFCSYLHTERFDHTKPLWHVYVMNGLADGRSLLVLKVDHVVADGVCLVQCLMSLLDKAPGAPGMVKPTTKRGRPNFGLLGNLGACLVGSVKSICDPCMPRDPPNKLKVKDHLNPGKQKAVATSEDIDLSRVNEVKDKFPGATVNDVLLTVVSLTLRRYYEEQGDTILKTKKRISANFPVNMRSPTEDVLSAASFGNRISQAQFPFPIEIEDPVEALQTVMMQTARIKASPEPLIRGKLLNIAAKCLASSALMDTALDAFGKVTAMLSNVAGPKEEVACMGQAVDDLAFYAMAPIGLYFGVLTYKGHLKAGVCMDRDCDDDASNLTRHFKPEFDRLYARVVPHAEVKVEQHDGRKTLSKNSFGGA